MDVLVPALIVALVVFGLAWGLHGRTGRRGQAGITQQPSPPGRASGSAQDTGEADGAR